MIPKFSYDFPILYKNGNIIAHCSRKALETFRDCAKTPLKRQMFQELIDIEKEKTDIYLSTQDDDEPPICSINLEHDECKAISEAKRLMEERGIGDEHEISREVIYAIKSKFKGEDS